MHSKYKIWDFIDQNNYTLNKYSEGLISFSFHDPLLRYLVQENIFNKFLKNNFRSLDSKDITAEWIDSNLNSLSLFGTNESFIIQNCEDLKDEIINVLAAMIIEGRYVILMFNKVNKLFTKLSKDSNCISIIEPPFWETDKLLSFVLQNNSLKLNLDAKEYILEKVNNTYRDFSELAGRLKLSFGEQVVKVTDLESYIVHGHIDNFEFARLLGFKKMNEFYKQLISLSVSFDELRSLFYFLQTHMLKVASTDQIYKKSKLTKYDKQIIEQSKIWSDKELKLVINFLKRTEFKAKLKNSLIINDLKSSFLKTIV